MPELRWTLLIIGVLFIAILAWWERRRPHQASRQSPHISGEPRPIVTNDPSWGPDVEPANSRPTPHIVREPTLTLPEIRTEARTRGPVPPRRPVTTRELPIVQIGDEVDSDKEISQELEEISEEISQDASAEGARRVSRRVEQEAEELEEELEEELKDEAEAEREAEPKRQPDARRDTEVKPPEAHEQDAVRSVGPAAGVSVEARRTGGGAEPVATQATGEQPHEGAAGPANADELTQPIVPVKPIVEWPPEDQRKLISLRLVARPPERFRGALVRQALYAEGFVLGDLGIFHKPDKQNRAVLSAASLTKPGTFDLDTMDIQRYVGLNLFAVLPGPKSPRKAFEDLLTTARMLNERLEGALQDDKGGPLTPTRIQALRDGLEAESKS